MCGTVYRENACKVMMYWDRTPEVLHAANPTLPNSCWRCGRDKGSLFHLLWTCSNLQPFWLYVKPMLEKILDTLYLSKPCGFVTVIIYSTTLSVHSFFEILNKNIRNKKILDASFTANLIHYLLGFPFLGILNNQRRWPIIS